MTFDMIRIEGVRRGSPGAQVGFYPGDQIIAVTGRVFPSLAAFAYGGSMQPGTAARVDYIPENSGPVQAQRVAVTVGTAGGTGAGARPSGLSTGTKVAIGVGATALLGCYELGCFSCRRPTQATVGPQSQGQPPGAYRIKPGIHRNDAPQAVRNVVPAAAARNHTMTGQDRITAEDKTAGTARGIGGKLEDATGGLLGDAKPRLRAR